MGEKRREIRDHCGVRYLLYGLVTRYRDVNIYIDRPYTHVICSYKYERTENERPTQTSSNKRRQKAAQSIYLPRVYGIWRGQLVGRQSTVWLDELFGIKLSEQDFFLWQKKVLLIHPMIICLLCVSEYGVCVCVQLIDSKRRWYLQRETLFPIVHLTFVRLTLARMSICSIKVFLFGKLLPTIFPRHIVIGHNPNVIRAW